jgi:protein tyrosine/serine phosphatase
MGLLSLPTRVLAIEREVAGVDNFHKVNEKLYRGAQPSAEGWASLKKLGVHTVVDLRRPTEHSIADEKKAVEAAGMQYVNFAMNGWDTPTAEQMAKLLPMLEAEGPVFVHCKQGRDRTGSVVAAYRIARERWTNDKAMAEANACGMHWFERGMKRFIAGYKSAPEALAEAVAGAADSVGAAAQRTPAP